MNVNFSCRNAEMIHLQEAGTGEKERPGDKRFVKAKTPSYIWRVKKKKGLL